MTATICAGDCRDVLLTIPERSVQCVITSPPYFGLRDYGDPGQIGLEPSPDEFVAALVQVFREVRRVLRDDGTVWVNLGDSYAGGNTASGAGEARSTLNGQRGHVDNVGIAQRRVTGRFDGVKPKDRIGIPWMVAFALRADGWYLRSDVVWSKPNPMPESVTDRPTSSHEYLFLLSKRPAYFYDQDAIREPDSGQDHAHRSVLDGQPSLEPSNGLRPVNGGLRTVEGRNGAGRNKRSVWTVATQPFSSERLGLGETEHFAVFPPKLIEPAVLAGSAARACGVCGAPWRRVAERESPPDFGRGTQGYAGGSGVRSGTGNQRNSNGGLHPALPRTVGWEPSCAHDDDTARSVVLDPFAGSGTVGVVCGWHGRDFIGIELNDSYAQMARERIALEGRPGGRPASHEPARANGHPSLFDLDGEAA